MFRISSQNGPATTHGDARWPRRRAAITVHSLAVQSTTLDDVFVHYTGRALRDAPAGGERRRTAAFMMRR